MQGGDPLGVVACGADRAEEVHRLTQAAFAPFRRLDPPSGAASESLADVIDDLSAGGGAIAEQGGEAVGCLRWQLKPEGDIHVRRVAIDPERQRRGIGRALMVWAEDHARRIGGGAVTVDVRLALPDNLAFFQHLGYAITGEHHHPGYPHPTYVSLRKPS